MAMHSDHDEGQKGSGQSMQEPRHAMSTQEIVRQFPYTGPLTDFTGAFRMRDRSVLDCVILLSVLVFFTCRWICHFLFILSLYR
jgi:hypothetical protein